MEKTGTEKPTYVYRLDSWKINEQGPLDEWDQLWFQSLESRMAIIRARLGRKPITSEMMQAYDKARNDERNYFWKNFWVKHEI